MKSEPGKNVLIAGAGFVGERLAELLHAQGHAVTALVRHRNSSEEMRGRQGFKVVAADLTNPDELANRIGAESFDWIVHCASSGRGGAEQYRAVFLGGAENLIELFPKAFLVFTSSTSVYGQSDGSEVTEDSPTEPDRETGQILLETEALVRQQGGAVARLAGLYGPGRSVILRKFLSGEARIEDGGQRHLNQIHRDDAASGILTILEKADQTRGQIYNIVDDQPMTQLACYQQLAEIFERPLPSSGPADPNRKRGLTDKRVSNANLRALGWKPQFPAFPEAARLIDQP